VGHPDALRRIHTNSPVMTVAQWRIQEVNFERVAAPIGSGILSESVVFVRNASNTLNTSLRPATSTAI